MSAVAGSDLAALAIQAERLATRLGEVAVEFARLTQLMSSAFALAAAPPPTVRFPPTRTQEERTAAIIDAVCKTLNVRRQDLFHSRLRARERGYAAYLLRKNLLHSSLPDIARVLGGRHHTTILVAIRRAQERVRNSREIAHQMAAIEQEANMILAGAE